MNNNLQNELANLVRKAGEAGSDVFSFVQQQAPELCSQIVNWSFYESLIGALASGALAGALWILAIKLWRKMNCQPIAAFLGFLAALLIILCSNDVASCIKCKVAPKLVVIEAMGKMLK